MASALSKEMAMMEAQLNQWKETAEEAIALRDEAVSLKSSLDDKVLFLFFSFYKIVKYESLD